VRAQAAIPGSADCLIQRRGRRWEHYGKVYNHATVMEGIMRIFLNIIGILLILAGGTFFLQGISILPGSYMTGDPQWAINGGILVVIGIGLMIWGKREK
jgi:hypothetical protein